MSSGSEALPGGDWPHTRRVLPWALAVFLGLLFLTPINAIGLPFTLPFDAKPDRIFLAVLALGWIAAMASAGPMAPRLRSSPIHVAGLVLLVVLVAGFLLGFGRMAELGELEVAQKRIALLGSYVVFFLIVASTLRPAELRPFLRLMVGLAAIAGAGTIVEYLTSTNVFYAWTDAVLPGSFDVRFAPSGSVSGRKVVVGPTQHGLAITTILAMALPFALQFAFRARIRRDRVLTILAVVLIAGGCVATLRKTGILAPAAAIGALLIYRPQDARRILAIVVAAVIGLAILVPSAASSIYSQLFVSDINASASTQGRVDDYAAVRPDVLSHLLLGRGYGSYDPLRYRILDNEVLFQLLTVGVIGLLCFIAVLAAGLVSAHRVSRWGEPSMRIVGIGTVGAIAAFALTTTTFDALSFVQVPYLLLFLLGSVAVALPAAPAPISVESGGAGARNAVPGARERLPPATRPT